MEGGAITSGASARAIVGAAVTREVEAMLFACGDALPSTPAAAAAPPGASATTIDLTKEEDAAEDSSSGGGGGRRTARRRRQIARIIITI